MEIAFFLVALTVVVLTGTAIAGRTGIPAPLLLIVVGVAGSFLPGVPEVVLEPEVVLFGLLPPLLYAAALQTSLVFSSVRARDAAAVGRLRIGFTPTARFGLAPLVLGACSARVPGVMLYPQEDTTGALLRDVRSGRLDLAVLFCARGSEHLCDEPAVVHVPADHWAASRPSVALEELSGETFLVAESAESGGFTARVLEMFAARGFEPVVRPDPYPDLGQQAVREGLGVVVYVRGAFPDDVPGSAFVPVSPVATFPFSLAWRTRSAALDAVVEVAREVVA